MSDHVDRLRQYREQAEAKARACRQREIAVRTKRKLADDAQLKAIDATAREARRALQINRLGVA